MTTEAIPSAFGKQEWDRYVRRGRKLVNKISGLQFDIGDLVIEMLHDRPHAHGEAAEIIEQFAHAIGLAPNTLRRYYQVARQWPEAKRRPDVCFSVHAELAYTRNRYSKIRKDPVDPFTGERRWTVNEAIRAADRQPHSPTNSEERLAKTRSLLHSDTDAAEAVREMLGRPDVRTRAASDPRTRNLMRQAQYEHWDQVDEAADAEEALTKAMDESEDRPDQSAAVSYDEGPLEILRLLGSFAAFFVSLQKTIPEIHAQDYTEETKEAVLDNIGKARSFLDWCESAITTGKTDMDKALARLLEDEEDGG
ncbi:DUF6192 family protein [Streptomyces sp. NPDC059396]|uniref:DUF6192 family protein n=1 Tax=Streptomyces sp. NPDC059396 TaxID=3346819 RepID=UPI003686F1F3